MAHKMEFTKQERTNFERSYVKFNFRSDRLYRNTMNILIQKYKRSHSTDEQS